MEWCKLIKIVPDKPNKLKPSVKSTMGMTNLNNKAHSYTVNALIALNPPCVGKMLLIKL